MNMLEDWKRYKREIASDASWRDIYVLKTTAADWQRFVDFLRSGRYAYDFSLGGELVSKKRDCITDIFEKRERREVPECTML